MDTRELPAGTLVHIQGIPCFLVAPAVLESGKGNWAVIEDAEAAEEAAINATDEMGRGELPPSPLAPRIVLAPYVLGGWSRVVHTDAELVSAIQEAISLSPLGEADVRDGSVWIQPPAPPGERTPPTNCRYEPAFPGLEGETVLHTHAASALVAHKQHKECATEGPHRVDTCGRYRPVEAPPSAPPPAETATLTIGAEEKARLWRSFRPALANACCHESPDGAWMCLKAVGHPEPHAFGAAEAPAETRCEGRYPVPQTSPSRDEPFDVTYRCALPKGHDGPHGSEPAVNSTMQVHEPAPRSEP